MNKTLTHSTAFEVKFSEADSLGIVWHGHYIRYFEDGREAFGKEYGIGYLAFYKYGFVTPIVNAQCDYKRSLRYGDTVKVETEFIPTDVAKMVFQYRLFNAETNELVATGSTIQVFLDKEANQLQLATPTFFEEWKKKYGLL